MKILKIIFVAIAGVAAVMVLDSFLSKAGVGLGDLSRLAVYALTAFLLLYAPEPKRALSRPGAQVEYIMTGQGTVTDQVFVASRYPGYSETSRSKNGRVFSNSSGQILCTSYGKGGQQGRSGTSRIHLLALCAISVGLSLMTAGLFRDLPGLPQLDRGALNAPFPVLKQNLAEVWEALSRIDPDIHLERCLALIKKNLEELSLLRFR